MSHQAARISPRTLGVLPAFLLAAMTGCALPPRPSPTDYVRSLPPRWQYVFSTHSPGWGDGWGDVDFFVDRDTFQHVGAERAFALRGWERGSPVDSIRNWEINCQTREVRVVDGYVYQISTGAPLTPVPGTPWNRAIPGTVGEYVLGVLCPEARNAS
jgi:hypothetical protein